MIDVIGSFNDLMATLNAYIGNLNESERNLLFQVSASTTLEDLNAQFEASEGEPKQFIKAAKLIQVLGIG